MRHSSISQVNIARLALIWLECHLAYSCLHLLTHAVQTQSFGGVLLISVCASTGGLTLLNVPKKHKSHHPGQPTSTVSFADQQVGPIGSLYSVQPGIDTE